MPATRRASLVAMMSTLVGGSRVSVARAEPPTRAGTLESRSIESKRNGSTYPLFVYLPPNSGAERTKLPIVYMLDGESRFQTLVDIAESTGTRVIIVGIGNEANRSHDYVPVNTCTEEGGGEAAFFDFIRFELIPFVEAGVGGDPARRALLGHSHGGSFVLYALFGEAPDAHHFSAYLAADPSIRCMPEAFRQWEAAYAEQTRALPVRLDISYANRANEPFARHIASRHYAGLTFASQFYPGGHNGMVQAAFTDALQFAFRPS